MSSVHKYQAWISECQKLVYSAKKQQSRRRKAAAAAVIAELIEQKKTKSKNESLLIHRIQPRRIYKLDESIYPTTLFHDETLSIYLRVTANQFKELLRLVGPTILKQNSIGKPITVSTKLAMTLRYLASGDCISSISRQYHIEVTRASNIIAKTCKALWNCLNKEVLPFPLKPMEWLNIAQEFENQWQFNHCIGAIDEKHVLIQSPDTSDFNNKATQSIVLLAICDANYMFTFIDIRPNGHRNLAGILRDSIIGQKFTEQKMQLPKPIPLVSGGIDAPYVLVGDEAFQLTDYLLRPYAESTNHKNDERIFNNRLGRARRTIENAFGILVSQWGILKKPIDASVDTTIAIVQSIICLHNFLRKQDDQNDYISQTLVDRYGPDGLTRGLWRQEMGNSAFGEISARGNNTVSRTAVATREAFCRFFVGEGAVPWQYNCEGT